MTMYEIVAWTSNGKTIVRRSTSDLATALLLRAEMAAYYGHASLSGWIDD